MHSRQQPLLHWAALAAAVCVGVAECAALARSRWASALRRRFRPPRSC